MQGKSRKVAIESLKNKKIQEKVATHSHGQGKKEDFSFFRRINIL